MSVRLHVLSDLHLEQAPFVVPGVEADVIVLGGDTATGTRGVDWVRGWADGRPVLYLAGNHEFYGHSLPDLIGELRVAAGGSSVRMLENDEVVIDGVRFLGCTLWSDFDFDGAERREYSMRVCERVVNDYEHIAFGPSGRTLAARDTRMLHLSSRQWLADRLAERHVGPTVVLRRRLHRLILRRRCVQTTVDRCAVGSRVHERMFWSGVGCTIVRPWSLIDCHARDAG